MKSNNFNLCFCKLTGKGIEKDPYASCNVSTAKNGETQANFLLSTVADLAH